MAFLVLGIDAAWTAHHPAGVALVKIPSRGQPQLLRLARSYEEFCTLSTGNKIDWSAKAHGSPPNMPALFDLCEKMTGTIPNVVALDIPIGPQPINGRRAADKMVTKTYIARKAGTHSPTAQRPGPISRMLYEQLSDLGCKWLHAKASPLQYKNAHVFIEAYPHPAIIELLDLNERLKYKVSKLQKYWPEFDRQSRWIAAARNLDRLRLALNKRITGVTKLLSSAKSFIKKDQISRFKGYEDAIDAVVCAWIGCEFLAGRCMAYGDDESAIWLPKPATRR